MKIRQRCICGAEYEIDDGGEIGTQSAGERVAAWYIAHRCDQMLLSPGQAEITRSTHPWSENYKGLPPTS